MCYGCWEEAEKPVKITPAVLACVPLVKQLYEFSCVGGPAHNVTDDWNIEDDSIDWCLENGGHPEDSAEERGAANAVLHAMKVMDEDERLTTLALFDGYIDERGREIDDDRADT